MLHMKRLMSLMLALVMIISLVPAVYAEPDTTEDTRDPFGGYALTDAEKDVIAAQSVKKKVNTIITTDGEVDDMASIIRWLHYANEFNIKGIVLSASRWHYSGGTVMNPDGTVSATRNQYRWCGLQWPLMYLEKYEEVYNNLVVHQPDMPTPEYLRSIYKIGNIKQQGEMTEETEGSNFIMDLILNNPDGENLVVNIWGGANTLCRALRSIEEDYKDTDDWERIYNKINNEVVAYFITDQDQSTPGSLTSYIRPNWPLMRVFYNNNTYNAVGYSFTNTSYFEPEWTNTILKVGSPLGSEYLVNGGGWDFRNAAIQQPTHTYYTEPVETKHNYFGDNYPYATWGESENRGDPARANAGRFMSEGDNPAFWFIQDVGLRSGLDHPEWGGWGGRFFRDPARTNNEYTDSATYTTETVISGMAGTAGRFSLQRWLPDMQSDFSVRVQWGIKDKYEDANHNPLSGVTNGLDLNVVPGQEINFKGAAYDPDGDELAYSWYRYAEVDTYGGDPNTNRGKGTFQLADTKDFTYTVPEDAQPGDTIHLIFETSDAPSNPGAYEYMKAYKRVVLTVEEAPQGPSKLALYITTGESDSFVLSLGDAVSASLVSSDPSIATIDKSSLTANGSVTVNTLSQGTAYIVITFTYEDETTSDWHLRVMSINSTRYADLSYSKLTPQEAVDAAYQRRAETGFKNARLIATTDNETDDMNSMQRLLMLSNDIDIVAIVYTSSTHHWAGDGINLYTGGNATIPMLEYRWMGSASYQVYVEEYRKTLENLRVHDSSYPDADYLRDMIFEGNIKFYNDMSADSSGVELIKAILLDERDDSPVWMTTWGGANSVAAALKSIEDEFKDTPEWPAIYARVSRIGKLYKIGNQDTTYNDYIRVNWPDLETVHNGNFGAWAFGASASNNHATDSRYFFRSDFHLKHILNHPYTVHYQTYRDGLNLTNISYQPNTVPIADGALYDGHIEVPMGWSDRFITGTTSHSNVSRQGLNSAKPDQPNATGTYIPAPWAKGARMHRQADPVGDPRWAEWGEPQHEDFGNPTINTYWGGTKPAAYNFYSEGDTPSFLSLVNNGLRTYEGPPGWGGWGGRFARTGTTGQYTAASDVVPAGVGGSAGYYPMSRFVPAAQRDWATRIQWSVTENYEDANHPPVVEVLGSVDLSAVPGQTLTLKGVASDPDGDALTYRWWRYGDADTHADTGTIELGSAADVTYTIPENAKVGDTIHLILEVDDRKTADPALEDLFLTQYQRVVITVGDVAEADLSLACNKIVAGYAANLPVNVTFTGEPSELTLNLCAPDGEILKTAAVSEDSRIVFSIIAAQAVAGTYKVQLLSGASLVAEADIICVAQPDDLWAPRVTVTEDTTVVTFASEVTFNATKKGAKIGDQAIASVTADEKVVTIGAAAASGQTIVVSGIKYADLFPSYSFTFTLLAP